MAQQQFLFKGRIDRVNFNVFRVKKHGVSMKLKEIPALTIIYMRLQCY